MRGNNGTGKRFYCLWFGLSDNVGGCGDNLVSILI